MARYAGRRLSGRVTVSTRRLPGAIPAASVQLGVGRAGGVPGQLAGLAAQHVAPQAGGVGAEDVVGGSPGRRTSCPRRSRSSSWPAPHPAYPAKMRSPARLAATSSTGVSRSSRPSRPTTSRKPTGRRRRPRRSTTARAPSVPTGPPWKSTSGSATTSRPRREHLGDRHRGGPVEHDARAPRRRRRRAAARRCRRSSGRAAPGWPPAASRAAHLGHGPIMTGGATAQTTAQAASDRPQPLEQRSAAPRATAAPRAHRQRAEAGGAAARARSLDPGADGGGGAGVVHAGRPPPSRPAARAPCRRPWPWRSPIASSSGWSR